MTSSEGFLQPGKGGTSVHQSCNEAAAGVAQKRPLQIFPLLKELNAGWGNMQVCLYDMNALVRRANTARKMHLYNRCILPNFESLLYKKVPPLLNKNATGLKMKS